MKTVEEMTLSLQKRSVKMCEKAIGKEFSILISKERNVRRTFTGRIVACSLDRIVNRGDSMQGVFSIIVRNELAEREFKVAKIPQ